MCDKLCDLLIELCTNIHHLNDKTFLSKGRKQLHVKVVNYLIFYEQYIDTGITTLTVNLINQSHVNITQPLTMIMKTLNTLYMIKFDLNGAVHHSLNNILVGDQSTYSLSLERLTSLDDSFQPVADNCPTGYNSKWANDRRKYFII
ncbi:hypothetical protein ACF0H5_006217 [Mactra antiquata]